VDKLPQPVSVTTDNPCCKQFADFMNVLPMLPGQEVR
jgi:hypothetical protein